MRPLPPLNALRACEAAARLGSFSRAAEELGVTHGAVSRHVQTLEQFLGAALFRPQGRGRVPTERAAVYLAEVSAALDRLGSATERMREPRSEEHTSELQSLMRISYAVFCLTKTKYNTTPHDKLDR